MRRCQRTAEAHIYVMRCNSQAGCSSASPASALSQTGSCASQAKLCTRCRCSRQKREVKHSAWSRCISLPVQPAAAWSHIMSCWDAPHLSGCTVVIDLPAKRSSRTHRCMLPSNLNPIDVSLEGFLIALPPLVVVLPLVLAFLAARTTRQRRCCRQGRQSAGESAKHPCTSTHQSDRLLVWTQGRHQHWQWLNTVCGGTGGGSTGGAATAQAVVSLLSIIAAIRAHAIVLN